MIDAKLKNELLTELEDLQTRLNEIKERLEQTQGQRSDQSQIVDRAERVPINTGIEFIGDFDLLEAEGVDISETGICFELPRPLPFDMQFLIDKDLVSRRAELIWVKQLPGKRSRLGLRFIDPDDPDSVIKKV